MMLPTQTCRALLSLRFQRSVSVRINSVVSTNRSVFIELMYFIDIDRIEEKPQCVFPMVRAKPAEITTSHNANDQQKQYQPG